MDNQPIRDERILEALEVCRAGAAEMSDPVLAELAEQLIANPELKRLYDRLQRVDVKLSAAFRDVPVPEDLARQIIDRLAADQAERAGTADVEETDEPPAHLPVTIAPARSKRVSRRRRLAVAGALSTGAALLVAALIYIGTRNPYVEKVELKEAIDFFSDESPKLGYLLVDHPSPEAYPISRDVRRFPGTRWREVRGFLGRDGVAYDLPGRRGAPRATLYVVKLTVGDLKETALPPNPRWNTGGYCGAAWQEGKLLYVLVVGGGSRAYEDCRAPLRQVT